jgi:hypothetical protein
LIGTLYIKRRVKEGKISLPFLFLNIARVTEDYTNKTGERPPYERRGTHPNTTFQEVKRGITGLCELNNLIDYLVERSLKEEAEQDANKRTREEWKELERKLKNEQITKEKIHQLIDSYVDAGLLEDDSLKERFKECKAYNCSNYFYAKNKKIQYCSYTCYYNQFNAVNRKKKHGTYLKKSDYLLKLETSKNVEWVQRLSEKKHDKRGVELEKLNAQAEVKRYFI